MTGTGLAVGTSFNISLNSAKNGGGTGDPGDIDNRIVTGPTGETYSYAPDNKRIAKTLTGGAGTQWFLWVGGMRIGTYTHNWNSGTSQWVLASSKEDWYVAGRRVAPSDRLGSDLTGGLKLMPYGEEIQPPNVPNDKTKFATYHRDATGLDYADQRYYSPGTGRFMTSDPYLASGGASSPSSWNRYAYVEEDPINKLDPVGLDYETANFDSSDPRNVAAGQNSITVSSGSSGIPYSLAQFMASSLGQSYPQGYAEILAQQTTAQTNPAQYYPSGQQQANQPQDPNTWSNPLPKKPPTGSYGDYLACVGGEWALTLSQDADQWVEVNAAPFAAVIRGLRPAFGLSPGTNALLLTTLAAVMDLSKAFEIRAKCTEAVYGPPK